MDKIKHAVGGRCLCSWRCHCEIDTLFWPLLGWPSGKWTRFDIKVVGGYVPQWKLHLNSGEISMQIESILQDLNGDISNLFRRNSECIIISAIHFHTVLNIVRVYNSILSCKMGRNCHAHYHYERNHILQPSCLMCFNTIATLLL